MYIRFYGTAAAAIVSLAAASHICAPPTFATAYTAIPVDSTRMKECPPITAQPKVDRGNMRVCVSKKLQACLGVSLIGGLIFCMWGLLAGYVVSFHIQKVGTCLLGRL